MADTIVVDGLSKSYTSYRKQPGFARSVQSLFRREEVTTKAVDQVSFKIPKGQIVGFLGPNGAGKTTTLKMLSGILHPTGGSATVMGYTPWERDPKFQRQIALVMGQKNQLWWDLPPADSFLLFKDIYQIPGRQYQKSLDELVELLQVGHVIHVPTRKLSLGQRMKCELIGALLHRPGVLFLDEPTIGLDVVSQANIREFILDYNRREQTTIILTSHYMEDIKALAKRVIIINFGKIVYDDSLATLTHEYGDIKSISLTFSQAVPKSSLREYGHVSQADPQTAVIDVPRTDATAVAAKILTKLPVVDINIKDTEADEIIHAIFTGEKFKQPTA